ncbi:alpha/beta hydrolase [Pseudonocardia sichuanensis]|uniref:Alpha-beta hydrolase superfamily lysophospholipase n=1 Tax=Pseudonocardia kunmingensis TaxID=630975 RepID=A0A543D9K9_9PSEU|nr:alpha/beta fold hydrolase [Pseudonocardia kunmingensis]TQM06023.1 alpha-beta hydrolase superfamily lysophospholipase [Pseudonocardia kunmingensis]
MTTRLISLDGTVLAADIVLPSGASRGVVLVHGGGVNRHEGGFFDRLAGGLARAGLASLRLDLRGHGESQGRQEDLTLAGVGNDVRAAVGELATRISAERVSVLGASFSGGVCASVAARYRDLVDRLVMINPLLDYKKRFIDDKDYWNDDRIDREAADKLAADRFIAHSPTFRLGAALLNEVFWWDTRADLPQITAPTLVVHGTKDTFIPIDSSRSAMQELVCTSQLIELDGAQHGLALHDDPRYENPQTQRWQSEAISLVSRWLTG